MPTFYNFRENGLDYSFDDIFVPADLFRNGNLWTWGSGGSGRLGNANLTNRSTPVTTFAGGSNWKQFTCGSSYTAAIKTDGTLWIWGLGTDGQLGNANITNRSTPVTTFAGGTNWKQLSCGPQHTAAIKTDGTLWTWGGSSRNVFQDRASNINASTPMTTSVGGTNWKQVSCGYWYTAAVKTDGSLWSWGYSYFGQLGRPDDYRYKGTPVTTFAGGTNWADVDDSEDLYTISVGVKSTIAIKTDGTLWTWGYGTYGELGNANLTDRSTPVTTFAGGTNWKQVMSGGYRTVAIKTDGTLWIWGSGGSGNLGNASTTNRSTPITTFSGGSNWKQVSGGSSHVAAIKTDGTLWTWGFGGNGRLGNAVITNVSTPVTTFAGGTNWKQVSAGAECTAAIKTDGTLWTWGGGGFGRLGNSDTTDRSTPVTTFAGGTNWKQVSSSGPHTSATKTDGTLWTWGEGGFGQLGNANLTNRSTPVTTFAGGTDWKQVSSGRIKTAAIKTDGTLWTWGYGASGQLGNAVTTNVSTPVTTFAGGTNWKQVSAGGYHVAALQDDGTNARLFVWGNGTNGRLGNATTTNTNSTPVTTFAGGNNWADVDTTEKLYTISAGGFYSSAIKTDGTLWSWGRGVNGVLGNFAITNKSTPITTFAGGTNWKQIDFGFGLSSAIKTDGTLWIWGSGGSGSLGNGAITGSRSTPITTFSGGSNWKQVSGGSSHVAAIKTDGTLWTWGYGASGQLGNAVTTNRSTPVTTFTGGTDWKHVNSGGYHVAATKTDGTLWIWGRNNEGQLGNANLTNTSTPVTTFAGGTNWRQVNAGSRCTVAIKTDGTLWTWGWNPTGQLGINNTTDRSTPVTTFAGGTNWKQVNNSLYHTAAIKTDGTLWTWGSADEGALGNNQFLWNFSGLSIKILTPITTFAGGTNWKQVITGDRSTLAIRVISGNYQLFAFGDTYYGELGGAIDIKSNSIPKPIFGNSFNWKQVDCGYHSTAAIKTDGTLWTWGRGQEGVLGAGGDLIFNALTPITTFAGGTNWKQVSVGGYYSNQVASAVKTDGTLWIWGKDNVGILGRGGPSNDDLVSTPITTFSGGTNWKSVSAGGYNVFGIKTNGTLWGWGLNSGYQLGVGDGILQRSTPVTTFAGGTNWKQVDQSFGYQMAAIEYADDPINPPDFFRLFAWGYGQLGQLGNATVTDTSTPVTTFAGGTNWKQISCGDAHTAATKTDGTLWTWGTNSYGRLGNGATTGNISTPVTTFAGGTNWKQLSAGYQGMAAVKTDGTLWIWGAGAYAQLGNAALPTRISTPVTTFAGGTDWKQVSTAYYHTAAIKTDGTLWIWGQTAYGNLGNSDNAFSNFRSTPITTFAGGTDWKQVSCARAHTAAVKTDGTLWVWGNTNNGRLGNAIVDQFGDRSTPVTTFAGGTNWQQVSTGGRYTAAVKTDGTLWVWGNTSNGVLGNGILGVNERSTPVTTFAGGNNWKEVSCGEKPFNNANVTAAIKTDGTLWVWGFGGSGRLGNGITIGNISTPITTFAGGTNWEQVSTGGNGVTAITKN